MEIRVFAAPKDVAFTPFVLKLGEGLTFWVCIIVKVFFKLKQGSGIWYVLLSQVFFH